MMNRLFSAVYARGLMLSENLRRYVLRGLSAWLAFISPMAMADGDIADIFNNVAEGATSGTKSALTIATFIGVLGIIGTITALKSMKNNPQVKPWMIALGFMGSLLLIAVPQIISRGQKQMGMTPVSVG